MVHAWGNNGELTMHIYQGTLIWIITFFMINIVIDL